MSSRGATQIHDDAIRRRLLNGRLLMGPVLFTPFSSVTVRMAWLVMAIKRTSGKAQFSKPNERILAQTRNVDTPKGSDHVRGAFRLGKHPLASSINTNSPALANGTDNGNGIALVTGFGAMVQADSG